VGLDTVGLVMAVEKRFSIDIPNAAAAQLVSVGQLHQYVVEQLPKQSSLELRKEEIYSILANLICYQLGVRREDVTPDARFVEDLGAD
jgi:acyl carrier protein